MAWIDDRIWCHPKIASVTKSARWAYVASIAYSSGFGTAGILDYGQQQMVGASAKDRAELLAAGLWDDAGDGQVRVHDWDEHNGKRDARKAADRERKKRTYRQEKPAEPPQEKVRRNGGERSGETGGAARVDRVTNDSSVGATAPTAEPAGTVTLRDDSQALVARFIDDARDSQVEVPRRVVGQIAKAVKDLLDEGQSPDAVWAGLGRMVERRIVQPSLLPNFVAEASLPRQAQSASRFGRGFTSEQILQRGRA